MIRRCQSSTLWLFPTLLSAIQVPSYLFSLFPFVVGYYSVYSGLLNISEINQTVHDVLYCLLICYLFGIRIIWISQPKDAVWGTAQTIVKAYFKLLRFQLICWIPKASDPNGASISVDIDRAYVYDSHESKYKTFPAQYAGNAITSRMSFTPHRIMARRSTPMPTPQVLGNPILRSSI